jgi:hypothetical protein
MRTIRYERLDKHQIGQLEDFLSCTAKYQKTSRHQIREEVLDNLYSNSYSCLTLLGTVRSDMMNPLPMSFNIYHPDPDLL